VLLLILAQIYLLVQRLMQVLATIRRKIMRTFGETVVLLAGTAAELALSGGETGIVMVEHTLVIPMMIIVLVLQALLAQVIPAAHLMIAIQTMNALQVLEIIITIPAVTTGVRQNVMALEAVITQEIVFSVIQLPLLMMMVAQTSIWWVVVL
jgi:hypothetical protein